jgi:hypothetical protein
METMPIDVWSLILKHQYNLYHTLTSLNKCFYGTLKPQQEKLGLTHTFTTKNNVFISCDHFHSTRIQTRWNGNALTLYFMRKEYEIYIRNNESLYHTVHIYQYKQWKNDKNSLCVVVDNGDDDENPVYYVIHNKKMYPSNEYKDGENSSTTMTNLAELVCDQTNAPIEFCLVAIAHAKMDVVVAIIDVSGISVNHDCYSYNEKLFLEDYHHKAETDEEEEEEEEGRFVCTADDYGLRKYDRVYSFSMKTVSERMISEAAKSIESKCPDFFTEFETFMETFNSVFKTEEEGEEQEEI